MTDNELLDAIKLLITILDGTTYDGEHYNCPECNCMDCYRVSCKDNKSELFKKLHRELPKLYEYVG